ncbi:MAG TPA: winged helix-turn-helix domain-containing protein, partial [Caulobacteraceae bacterium]|nr:winged helix-turn-helix domain-containing protein [Caulobacteraceae bacterium]
MSVAEELTFGRFRLSVRRRTLATDDGAVVLPSRAFDVLVTLIEGREAPIGKDELMRRVWGDIFVEENNLHVQIAAIRRALGPDHILTIPGRGYRFVTDVTEEAAAPAPPPPRLEAEGPGNLPIEVTPLVGRASELADTLALLERARLVTLVGPGGVGKTKLALATAREASMRFADGAFLLELGALADPALTASALAACLKVEEVQDRPLLANLLAALRPRRMLLVVDGCEHVLAAVAALISEIVHRCPEVRLLCTSQTPLGVEGEHVRRVAPFEVGALGGVTSVEAAMAVDAVQLFAERAGAGDGRFALTEATLPGVLDICRILEGVPLALELAAARVPLLGLEPVRQRIANRLALLGEDRSDSPQRHRTLRATIEWSHGLLPDRAREILRRLSVFAGGFTLEAAQQVASGAGIAEWDIVRGVGDLVRRSMLTNGPDLINPRHRMLEVMRAFALEALEAAGEREVVAHKHAEYFCQLAEAADARWETRGDVDWALLLAPELENLRAALEWTLGEAGAPRLGAQLAAATARFWFEASLLSEGRRWLTRALDRAPPDLDAASRIRLQRGLADLCTDPAAAIAAAEAALALAEQQDGEALTGPCLRALAAASYRQGDYVGAERLAKRAFEALEPSRHPHTQAQCYADLGILRGVAGDHAEARRLNAQARARLQALGDRRGVAICLQYAAEFEFAAGETGAAEALGEESVGLFRALGGRYHLGIGLGNLAAYRLAGRDPARAAEAAREALVIADEVGDHAGVVISIESLALALARLGQGEDAARLQGFVEAAYGRLDLERQETEQLTHDRL